MSSAALHVDDVHVRLRGGPPIVEGMSFGVERGEILGLVGESGSGKTTAALALLGFARPGVEIAGGSVRVEGEELLDKPETARRRLRGQRISYVPQDPSTALSPAQRIGTQLERVLHHHLPAEATDERARATLKRVGLPGDHEFRRRFPHQLSGGQQQRVAIAIAIACDPSVVVLDEPTTGLDVITQAIILDEVRRLARTLGTAMVYVSHDLAVVADIADRVAVMYAGRLVEVGRRVSVLEHPRHPYTSSLISAIPDHVEPRRPQGVPGAAVGVGNRPKGCKFAPRCPLRTVECEREEPPLERIEEGQEVRCWHWPHTPPVERGEPVIALPAGHPEPLLAVNGLRASHRGRRSEVVVADGVTFAVAPRESVALVGESGSGKTTIARCIAGLHAPDAGELRVDGEPLPPRARARSAAARRRIQIVFQNPYDSLNPRRRVGEAVEWPAQSLRGLSPTDARLEAESLLERLRLPARLAERYPRELSGGERQRVAIARALAAGPELLVCDEITSALDVSVQAAVLELLADLRRDLKLALLVISHDLGVVASVADRILVLESGRICEQGSAGELLAAPETEYARRLIEAAPRLAAHA
jgi:peptide/nickel transport system ATP-binding protein